MSEAEVGPVNPFSATMSDCCALPKCNSRKGQAGIELKACGACTIPHYCCKEHQVEHFKNGGHKHICKGRKTSAPLTFAECNANATNHYNKQEYKDAVVYFSAMIELTERTCGLFHLQIANLLDFIVKCYLLTEQYDDAIACLNRMLIIYELDQASTTTFDESILSDKNAMIEALQGTKMSKQAFITLGRLAEVYMTSGQVELSKELFQKIVDEASINYGEESFEKGRALLALAVCLETLGEHEKAEEKLLQAAALKEYGVSPNDDVKGIAASLFFNLAIIQNSLNKKSEAIANLETYIKMKKETGCDDKNLDIIEANNYIQKYKEN